MARPSLSASAVPVGRVITILRRNGVRKGLVGGSRGWAAVAIGAWGYTQLKKLAQRDVEVVFREELKPGERIIFANNVLTVDRDVDAQEQSSGT